MGRRAKPPTSFERPGRKNSFLFTRDRRQVSELSRAREAAQNSETPAAMVGSAAQVQAVLDMSNLTAFEQLLGGLTSVDNSARTQYEALFNECKKQGDVLCLQLVKALRTSAQVETREMAAILLRRVLTKDEVSLWANLQAQTQAGIKSELLKSLHEEQNKRIAGKVGDTVSELAAGVYEEGWPELLPFLFQCVTTGSDALKVTALNVFGELAAYIGDSLVPHLATLHGILAQCLQAADMEVKLASLRACCAFVDSLENQHDRAKFQDLLPAMLQTLGGALQGGDEASAQDALSMFVELAGSDPRFVRKHLAHVVDAMMTIAEHNDLENGTRHLATEFLVTLTEARDRAPGMMRKLPNFVPRLFNCLVAFLLDIEDEQEWHTAEKEEDGDVGEGERYDVGQECLDRVAIALGANTVLPCAATTIPALLQDGDWRKRHAALVALAQIAEGCVKGMNKDVAGAVTPCLGAATSDPHPRVRWAAVNGIGQLCTDLGPKIQEKAHAQILPVLLKCMEDSSHRVQSHAAAAMVNFSEGCPPEHMQPYLDALMNKLLQMLQGGHRMVQESALTALASVADNAQTAFAKYYSTVLPFLKQILVGAAGKEHRMLRAKAMECISLVGMAVGKEQFAPDAREVMDLLMQLQAGGFEDDDTTASYMQQAWTRLCKCLGRDFIQYLQVVMPPLLKSAQLKPDVQVTDAEDAGEEEEEDDVEVIAVGDKRISIRTSVLEEKATACNMLCCYVDELKDGFLPYLQPVVETMVPLLDFYFHEDVRKAAVASLPDILRAGKAAMLKQCVTPQGQTVDAAYFRQLVGFVVPPLIKALNKEPEVEIQAAMLESLADCAGVAGEHISEHISAMIEEFQATLKGSLERRAERNKRATTEDFDAEEMDALTDEQAAEDEVFDQFAECVGSLLRSLHAPVLPALEPLLAQFVAPMLAADRSPEERRIAICVFDDVMEHASDGGAALRYLDGFAGPCLAGCTDADADVRQASVYGVGVMAEKLGAAFAPHVPASLQALAAVIQAPDSRTDENVNATENAISSLGKLCEFQRNVIPGPESVVPQWLQCLPLTEDKVEARAVHEQLVRMLEKNDPHLLGPNSEHLGSVVKVFATALPTASLSDKLQLCTPETARKMKVILMQMQGSVPPETLSRAWSSITAEQQQALQQAMQA